MYVCVCVCVCNQRLFQTEMRKGLIRGMFSGSEPQVPTGISDRTRISEESLGVLSLCTRCYLLILP